MRIASSATSSAVSVAKSFAIPASRSARSPASFRSRRLQHQQARRLDLRRHLRELELDRLVLRDRLAERLALLRVADRLLEARAWRSRPPRAAMLTRPSSIPPMKYLKPSPTPGLAAEHRVGRRAEPVEDELDRLDALVAELAAAAAGSSGPAAPRPPGSFSSTNAGHARGGAARPRDRSSRAASISAGAQAVRRPHLLAGDHVLVAVADARACGSPARPSPHAARSSSRRSAARRSPSAAGSARAAPRCRTS